MTFHQLIARVFLAFFTLTLAACGGGTSNGSTSFGDNTVDLENFAKADVVIGQADFQSGDANRGGSAGQNTLNRPWGAAHANGVLYLSDNFNHRVLAYDSVPDSNGQDANFVLGQPDFTTTNDGTADDKFSTPTGQTVANNKLFTTDLGNNRVLIFDPAPIVGQDAASVVVGQNTFSGSASDCSASGLHNPESSTVVDGKLIVADGDNHRILIWNSVPTSNGATADLVLGQTGFNTCAANDDTGNGTTDGPTASTLDYPSGVWSNGERLAVTDTNNSRVLIWESFPTSNGEPADVVLGQKDFTSNTANDDNNDGSEDKTPSARTLKSPWHGIDSNGEQLMVSDHFNNRVLIWDSFPTSNFEAADQVLGQGAFDTDVANDADQDGSVDTTPSAETLNGPQDLEIIDNDSLLVADRKNHRVLIYRE